jgi:hypothetical protein
LIVFNDKDTYYTLAKDLPELMYSYVLKTTKTYDSDLGLRPNKGCWVQEDDE